MVKIERSIKARSYGGFVLVNALARVFAKLEKAFFEGGTTLDRGLEEDETVICKEEMG